MFLQLWVVVRQFTQHFVSDCIESVFTYFSDESRMPRLADRMEEEVAHHSSIMQQWNNNNVNLVPLPGQGSQAAMFVVPSVPSSILGQLRSSDL